MKLRCAWTALNGGKNIRVTQNADNGAVQMLEDAAGTVCLVLPFTMASRAAALRPPRATAVRAAHSHEGKEELLIDSQPCPRNRVVTACTVSERVRVRVSL